MHSCYVLYSIRTNKIYIGYTIDFNRRLKQHNGLISGGAKKTFNGRPWIPYIKINGFLDKSSALRFEYRLQMMTKKIYGDPLIYTMSMLIKLINMGEGSKNKDTWFPWPELTVIISKNLVLKS